LSRWSRSRTQVVGVVIVLMLVAAWAPIAHACKCVELAPGFRVGEDTRLPANAVGVPWIGRVQDDARPGGKPQAEDFRIEVRDGSFWRALAPMVIESPDLAQALKGPDDEPIVLVGPRGGFRPGTMYRMSSSLRAERSAVEIAVAERSFWVGKLKATATVAPVVSGLVVAATRSGSCVTTFQGVSTTVKLVLPESLERFRGALLFAFLDAQGRVWRPDLSLCERTPTGASSMGPGHERLYASCGPLHAPQAAGSADTTGAAGESRPTEESVQGREMKFEFVAWLPGTTERISAKGRVTLECQDVEPSGILHP